MIFGLWILKINHPSTWSYDNKKIYFENVIRKEKEEKVHAKEKWQTNKSTSSAAFIIIMTLPTHAHFRSLYFYP